jgi:hypothetical protein
MNTGKYGQVCYRTEQRDENVFLRNLKDGRIGSTFGCTSAGETLQVKLADGGLDSWSREECVEVDSGAQTGREFRLQ